MSVTWQMALQIFAINFSYITLNTIRFMLTMKGYRFLAPLVSFVEIIIYIIGLNLVMKNLDNAMNIIAYALGYSIGIGFGILLEDILALGYSLQRVHLPLEADQDLASRLRDKGYGVTVYLGHGINGERLILEVLSKRREEKELRDYILSQAPSAFIVSSEPKYIHGGFWAKRMRKNREEFLSR
ncbi:DUF2179 domain-containing protein [Atopobacter sp. AH10]|uniref:DUF2179 domain-containing protein n=1 Tax=Atopobacter sp. AH10 TaxID=2315861 RepID=UPI000EF178B3|nr:DUF2179 domain-containing protein [Atopobacter sp. AH10]RLK64070.1 DUF2179 domain-containing protein [Atopobacter sp. AH10]